MMKNACFGIVEQIAAVVAKVRTRIFVSKYQDAGAICNDLLKLGTNPLPLLVNALVKMKVGVSLLSKDRLLNACVRTR